MKNQHKSHLKHSDTNLETDIDDSCPLSYPVKITPASFKKKNRPRPRRPSPKTVPYQVPPLPFRNCSGSSWSTLDRPWECPATKNNVWICPSASPRNCVKWYLPPYLGSRQRCRDRSINSLRLGPKMLRLASIRHSSQNWPLPYDSVN